MMDSILLDLTADYASSSAAAATLPFTSGLLVHSSLVKQLIRKCSRNLISHTRIIGLVSLIAAQ
jgi:hypothetical protein